ncbi:MAG: RNA polymerase sigma-70 factor (ECF subfamily) [Mariniblastus sp.]|jgi:RNA polymerase sigma-70 factor (ECF subfamily)
MSELPEQSSSGDSEATRFSLIAKAQANESEAWDVVFALYAPLIKRWARADGVRCPHEVDNVCQDVFAKIILNLSSFERLDKGSFRGWLRTITRNLVFSHHIGNKGKFQSVGGSNWHDYLNEIPFHANPKSLFDSVIEDISDEKNLLFRQIIAWIDTTCTAKQRDAFHGVVIELSPAKDVAAELGLTVNVVYQYKSRILARIREVFGNLV